MATRTERHVIVAALISKAAKIEADLTVIEGKSPTALQLLLIKARNQAIESCAALINAAASDTALVQSLQNDVRNFIDLVEFARVTLDEAAEAEQDFTQEDLKIVGDLVLGEDMDTYDAEPADTQQEQ